MATSATLRNPPWMDGITFAGQDARLATVAAFLAAAGSSGTTGIASRAGVRPGVGSPLLVAASSGMNITVNNGIAFAQGTASLDAGPYPVVLDATITLTVTTADPSNPRIDNVCLTVVDNGDNTSTFVVQIQAGTPASSPVAPTLPANSLLLATIQVAAGASSISSGNITDQRLFATALGGILLCSSSAQYPASGPSSQYLHDGTTGRLRRLNGAGGTVPPQTAPFAATNAQVTSSVTCTSTTKVLVASVTVTTDGATKVKITASWPYVRANTANVGDNFYASLWRDTTQLKTLTMQRVQTSTTAMDGTMVFTVDTPTAGTHTYALYVSNLGAAKSFSMVAGGTDGPIDLLVEPAPL